MSDITARLAKLSPASGRWRTGMLDRQAAQPRSRQADRGRRHGYRFPGAQCGEVLADAAPAASTVTNRPSLGRQSFFDAVGRTGKMLALGRLCAERRPVRREVLRHLPREAGDGPSTAIHPARSPGSSLEHAGRCAHLAGGKLLASFRHQQRGILEPSSAGRCQAHGSRARCGFQRGVGRLAYLLGFRGPTMSIDAASRRRGVGARVPEPAAAECHLALAGGVNLILSPRGAIYFCKVGVWPTWRSRRSTPAPAGTFAAGMRLRGAQRLSDVAANDTSAVSAPP